MTFKERLTTYKNGFLKALKAVQRFLVTQEERNRRLMEAVRAGDLARVEKQIAEGAQVNSKHGWSGDSPLIEAVDGSKTDIVRALLAAKGDPNASFGYYSATPMWKAVRKGNMEIITLLLDAGGNANVTGENEVSAFAHAVSRKNKPLADLLLARGADADRKDKYGWTPLFYAARNGDAETVKLLLDRGARTYLRDHEGRSVLQVAEEAERFAVRGIIQAHIDAQVPEWQKVSDKEIAHVSIFRRQGYRLTETFNFETKTCAVIAHNFTTGRDALLVQSFDEMKNPALLKAATDKLAALGAAPEQQNTPPGAEKKAVAAAKPGT